MVAFVRTPWEVSDAVRRDQQLTDGRVGMRAFFRAAVFAELAVQVAQLAVGHAIHDGGTSAALAAQTADRRVGAGDAPQE